MFSKRTITTLFAIGYLAVCLAVHAVHVHPVGSGDCGANCDSLVHHHHDAEHTHEHGHHHGHHHHHDAHGHSHTHCVQPENSADDKGQDQAPVPHSHDDCAICQFLAIVILPGVSSGPEIVVEVTAYEEIAVVRHKSAASISLIHPRGPPVLG